MSDLSDFALLAPVLEYPGPATAAAAREAAGAFSADPALGSALDALAAWLEGAADGEPEERYTRLFDLSPVCTLHAGYHLFGEAYQRGSLLAGLAEELRLREVPTGEDLPDFLPTLFRLFTRLDDADRQALAETLLLPALAHMTAALDGTEHPWADLVRALPAAITATLAAPPLLLPARPTELEALNA